MKQPRNVKVPILNREFKHPSDGWYMIEPKGVHPNARAGVVQVIDEEAGVSIVNRFNEQAAAPDFPGLLVDHEHFAHAPDQESRAYGWLMALENRKDGIYGQIKWTATGQAAVDGGDYRFFSTEYAPDNLLALNKENGQTRVRPLALAGLTITNDPNNKGGKPITNRADPDQFRQAAEAEAEKQQTKENPMTKTTTLLGLSADASDEAAAAEVSKITNRATTAEAEASALKVTIAEMTTKLDGFQAEAKKVSEDMADADLAPIKNRLTPEHYATLRGLLISNRAATLPIVEMIPKDDVPPPQATPAPIVRPAPVLNRGTTATPPAGDPLNVGAETFDVLVNRAMTDKKLSKSAAIDVVMVANREAYIAWREKGGLL